MKAFNQKQMEYLKDNFEIWEDDEVLQIEGWTDGGVNMVIYIDKRSNDDFMKQFIDYYDNFDIDDEIDCYRQDEQYCKDFRITESVKDFTDWQNYIEQVLIDLKKLDD